MIFARSGSRFWSLTLLASLASAGCSTKSAPEAAAPSGVATQSAARAVVKPPMPTDSPARTDDAKRVAKTEESERKPIANFGANAPATPAPDPAAVAYVASGRTAPEPSPAPARAGEFARVSSVNKGDGSGAAAPPSLKASIGEAGKDQPQLAAAMRKAPMAIRPRTIAEKKSDKRDADESSDLGATESYSAAGVNPLVETAQERVSTFAMDVDTASYTIIRRKLLEGRMPPPEAVRIEEMLNYFHFPYPQPQTGMFAVQLDAVPSPFSPGRHLMRVGVQAKSLPAGQRRAAHLTFLIDISGSMASHDKLPLMKQSLRILVDALQPGDTVGIVTFATTVKIALPATPIQDKAKILAVLDGLRTGGNTAMAEGLVVAYKQAIRDAGPQGISRVILVTDADANVGATTHEEMHSAIATYIKEGVTLSAIGVGAGNFKDAVLEPLADKGNGNYYYIDSLAQARRVFDRELAGTLQVVAVDAKLQVEFNPESVRRYRLLGYENRQLATQDFRNDQAVAGQVGAGHNVTAIYEVELVPGRGEQSLATVHLRARPGQGAAPEEQSFVFPARSLYPTFDQAPPDLRFAAAVTGAAEILRRSPYARGYVFESVHQTACAAVADDPDRVEFCSLLGTIRRMVERIAAR
jgi:Ca-activated chloride channel family protein